MRVVMSFSELKPGDTFVIGHPLKGGNFFLRLSVDLVDADMVRKNPDSFEEQAYNAIRVRDAKPMRIKPDQRVIRWFGWLG